MIDIAPGGPAAGRLPARARKRPAHPSSRPGKDREQVCCVAWRPPCAAVDGATSTADGATSTKVDARRHAPTARFQSLALQRHARAARFPIADLSPRRTGRRPRRWTPGGTPPRRDFNRQPFSGTPAQCDVNRQPRGAQSSVREGGRPAARPRGAISIASPSAARPHGAISIASPSPLTPANHRLPQRTGQRPLTEPHN